jgi:hypothetical protein
VCAHNSNGCVPELAGEILAKDAQYQLMKRQYRINELRVKHGDVFRQRLAAATEAALPNNANITAPSRLNSASARRPNGYQALDRDSHGRLPPGSNRATDHTNTQADNYVQSHHAIQYEWARHAVPGYSLNVTPAVLLPSNSGSAHAAISAAQRVRRAQPGGWNTPIREKFRISYREMIDAGVSEQVARRAISQNYKYFDALGAFR